MEIELIGLQRARASYSEYDEAGAWKPPPYLLTFCLRGCAATLQDVADAAENLSGLTLDRCVREEGAFLVAVEAPDGDWQAAAKVVAKALGALPKVVKPINAADISIDALLSIDLMEMQVGYGLIRLIDASKGGDLLDRIAMIRRHIALELGIIVPPVRIRDNMSLGANDYQIMIRGREVAKGEVFPDCFLAMDNGAVAGPVLNARRTTEPAFNLPAYWITAEQRPGAELLNYTVVEATAVVATHLTELIRAHADELLTRQDAADLVRQLRQRQPAIVDEVIPALIRPGELQKILQNLVRQGISIRDLGAILEAIGDHAGETKDIDRLTEHARTALTRNVGG